MSTKTASALNRQNQKWHLLALVGGVALSCYYQQRIFPETESPFQGKPLRLRTQTQQKAWQLLEEVPEPDKWNFQEASLKEFIAKTPLQRDEFLLADLSHDEDLCWAIVGPHRTMGFNIKETENSAPGPLLQRSIEATDSLLNSLEQVRSWTRGQPPPPWLTISKRGENRETSSRICLYLRDDNHKTRIFSLVTNDSQVSELFRTPISVE